MTNDIPSTGVGAVAVNPQNNNMIIIGTGEGYRTPVVYKTTSGGDNWI